MKESVLAQIKNSKIFKNAPENSKFYGLFGHPIGHSYSPLIHGYISKNLNEPYLYDCMDVDADDLSCEIASIKKHFAGFNCTIPLKQAILPFLDEVDDKAALYGAVNTVKNDKGRLKGFNTDAYGFLRALKEAGIPLKGRVLLLGAGGAARMMAHEIVHAGCELTIAARDGCKACTIAADVYSKNPHSTIHTVSLCSVKGKFDLIVNATPVGMSPRVGECPVGEEIIKSASYLFDAIYNPCQTEFLKIGKKHGAVCENGASMLVYQALEAAYIWMGKRVDEKEERALLALLKRNLSKERV